MCFAGIFLFKKFLEYVCRVSCVRLAKPMEWEKYHFLCHKVAELACPQAWSLLLPLDSGFWTGSAYWWWNDRLRGYQVVQGSWDHAELDALQPDRCCSSHLPRPDPDGGGVLLTWFANDSGLGIYQRRVGWQLSIPGRSTIHQYEKCPFVRYFVYLNYMPTYMTCGAVYWVTVLISLFISKRKNLYFLI